MQRSTRGVLGVVVAALLATTTGSPAGADVPDPAAAAPVADALPGVIPKPAEMTPVPGGGFRLTADTVVVAQPGSAEALRAAGDLAARLRPATGYPLPVVTQPRDGAITVHLDSTADLGEEGYRLASNPGAVRLTARTAAGLFYATQTLRQLLPSEIESPTVRARDWVVPGVQVTDRPRFGWRGAMLDVARHFFTVDEVKGYVDQLAAYKINRLHLHLTDNQGWRIDIRSWPRLATHGGSTEVGGGPGGYYTQEDFAAIVRYAAERHVLVIPEIDMPAHVNAAQASYGELTCDGVAPPLYTGWRGIQNSLCIDKPVTYRFVEDVIREVAAITPGPYLNIGGDEALATTDEDYRYFLQRAQAIVRSHGKTMIGWEEIAAARPAPDAIAQHWAVAGKARNAVAQGLKVIMSPSKKVYFDMKYDAATPVGLDWAGYNDAQDSYSWDPVTQVEGVGEADVLGPEPALWTETVETIEQVELMTFPRLPGVAEIGWSPATGRSWDEYRYRLAAQAPRWDLLGITYYRSAEVPWDAVPAR